MSFTHAQITGEIRFYNLFFGARFMRYLRACLAQHS
jgi:hypothetical protein